MTKKFESNYHQNNHHIQHHNFQHLMINQLTSGSPSPSVLPLAQKTQEEQIWKRRKRQLSVLSLCVICTLMKMGILCQLQDGVTRGAIDEASRSLIAIDNAQFPPVLALNVLLIANLFYRYKKSVCLGFC